MTRAEAPPTIASLAADRAEQRNLFVDGALRSGDEVRQMFAASHMADRAERCLRMIEGERIVDIGCYAGIFVRRAQANFPDSEILGIDYDEENLKVARFLYPERAASFHRMSVYALDFEDASIDCIAFQEVIEHVEGAAQAIKEINRVLRPGGSLVVTTPNAYYWRQFAQHLRAELANAWRRRCGRAVRLEPLIFFDNVEWNRHIYCWTPATLMTLLAVNGFAYEAHEYSVDDPGPLSRLIGWLAPALGNTIVLKVRKVAGAPAGLV